MLSLHLNSAIQQYLLTPMISVIYVCVPDSAFLGLETGEGQMDSLKQNSLPSSHNRDHRASSRVPNVWIARISATVFRWQEFSIINPGRPPFPIRRIRIKVRTPHGMIRTTVSSPMFPAILVTLRLYIVWPQSSLRFCVSELVFFWESLLSFSTWEWASSSSVSPSETMNCCPGASSSSLCRRPLRPSPCCCP